MASDLNLKCSQFRCTMAVSYCATKCPYSGRSGKQCGDLAKTTAANPDTTRAIIAGVVAAGTPIHSSFKAAFPAFLPEDLRTAAPPPSAPAQPRKEAAKAVAVPRATAASTVTAQPPATEPAPPAASAASKPADTISKERTMVSNDASASAAAPAAGTSTPPAGDGAPKRRGGVRKGHKFGKRTKKPGTVAGMVFFIETEPNSGVFALIQEPSMGDFLTLKAAHRRVVGATDALEL